MEVSGEIIEKLLEELPCTGFSKKLVITRVAIQTRYSVIKLNLGLLEFEKAKNLSGQQTFTIYPEEKQLYKRAELIVEDAASRSVKQRKIDIL